MLLSRESALRLQDPGPDAAALETIFRSALRAPDHGRLRPWHFIVVPPERRQHFGEVLAESLRRREPNAPPEALERERQKALRAPLIIVVAARLKASEKIPEVEQIISAGAAAQNIMLAAHALGYGAMWRTGAPAYDEYVKQALGLEPAAAIIGFLYLGTRAGGASPVPRPAPEEYVAVWQGPLGPNP